MDEFLVRALLAGLGLALVAGPLGCFVVWRRMAYFGDTLAHSALLGVVAGLALGISLPLGVAVVAAFAALLLAGLEKRGGLAADTLLGILSHGALAAGLVALAFIETVPLDMMAWLFGDILSVAADDVVWIWGGGACVLAAMAALWRPLVAACVSEDLAHVEGHPVGRLRIGLMVLVALVVAAAMKVVGILLVTSMLVVPAAAARRFARTPEQMAALAALAGALGVALGLWGSWHADTPSGPSIVVATVALFAVAQALPGRD